MALLWIAYERLLNAIHNEDTLADLPLRGPAPRPAALRGALARPAGADAARVDPALDRVAGHRRGDDAAAARRGLLDPAHRRARRSPTTPTSCRWSASESAAFGPTDRIGQLTLRNLDIADSRSKLELYADPAARRGPGPRRARHLLGALPGRRRRPDRQQPRPRRRRPTTRPSTTPPWRSAPTDAESAQTDAEKSRRVGAKRHRDHAESARDDSASSD